MRVWIWAIVWIVSACSFEPRYHRPCMEMPQSWRLPASEETTCANIEWWKEIGDPILDALILQALNNNNDLQRAAWRVYDFYSRYMIAFSPLLPEIDNSGSASRIRFPQQTSFLPAGLNPVQSLYNYAFTLDWIIDIWGQLRAQAHAGFEMWIAAAENRRKVLLTVVTAVAQSYITLRQLDKELEISYLTLAERQEYLRLAKLRFEGGLTSEIEVMQALSILQETESFITQQVEMIAVQENLLSVLIGENPTCIIRGKAVDEFSLPPTIPAGLPSDLLARRPDIMEVEALLIAANANIGAARAAFFPQITLTGLFGGTSFQLNQLFSTNSEGWTIGGQYLLPLFTGGRLLGQLHLAQAEKQEMVYEYRQTILNAFKEVNDALIAHQQAKKLVEVQKVRVDAVTEYLHLAWLRYYEGEADYLTVLDAERELYTAQIQLTQAQGSTFSTLVDIYKSLGGGWVVNADFCLRSHKG